MSYSLLALSGSLRTRSINSEVLLAVDALSPEGVSFTHYNGLGALPLFNPDHDVEPPPRAVAEWRAQLEHADAVVICTPEYAHGVPGALKNAFDWVVGSGELMGKPVAILCASAASQFVGPQLTETLTVMMANVVLGGSLSLPLARRAMDSSSIQADNELAAQIRAMIDGLMAAVDGTRATTA